MTAARKFLRLAVAIVSVTLVAVFASARPLYASEAESIRAVRVIVATPVSEIDFAKAKLTFDKILDPSTDIPARLKEIDAMAQTIKTMAGPSAPSRLGLIMLRKYIYEGGGWNGNKPFR